MAIPRNLVYVFACVIVFAFLGMLFIVYTERDLKSFISLDGNTDLVVRENLVVHPLFEHLKNAVPAIDTIPYLSLEDMTPKKFYQEYLTNSLPFTMVDGCRDWPAFESWQNLSYLGEEFGNRTVLVMKLGQSPGQQDVRTMFGKRYTFSDFVNLTGSLDLKGNKQLYYIRNEMILSRTLAGDIVRPLFISKALRARHTGLTVWPSFDDRRPEFSNRERYVCLVSGIEEFRLVSPVFKQNLYSGVLEELRPNETPLDFFKNVNAS